MPVLTRVSLSQGVYNKPDSIVVLCTYLGQLTKIRDALASCKLSVVLDERDEEKLLERDEKDRTPMVAEVSQIDVSKQVCLFLLIPIVLTLEAQIRVRTVDNFQGRK